MCNFWHTLQLVDGGQCVVEVVKRSRNKIIFTLHVALASWLHNNLAQYIHMCAQEKCELQPWWHDNLLTAHLKYTKAADETSILYYDPFCVKRKVITFLYLQCISHCSFYQIPRDKCVWQFHPFGYISDTVKATTKLLPYSKTENCQRIQ